MKFGSVSLGSADKSSTGAVIKSPGTREEYVADTVLLLNCRSASINRQTSIDVMLRKQSRRVSGKDERSEIDDGVDSRVVKCRDEEVVDAQDLQGNLHGTIRKDVCVQQLKDVLVPR